MTIKIPEQVARGAIALLADSKHPDVRHLVRELQQRVGNVSGVVTVDEWDAVMVAIDQTLVQMGGLQLTPISEEIRQNLRTVRPKIDALSRRQAMREA